MRRLRIQRLFVSFGLSLVVASAGCDEPCPPGYDKRAGTCYLIKDAGSDAAETYEEEDGSLGHGVDPVTPQFDASLGPGPNDAGSMVANLDATSDATWPGADASPEAGLDASQPPSSIDTGVEMPKPDAATTARPCDPTPCSNGGTCSVAADAYTCKCVDGYTGTNCELEICDDVAVRSRADVDDNRLCAEIRGTLDISAVGLGAITADDFPFLKTITGRLTIRGAHSAQGGGNENLQTVTLSKLETVGGGIQIVSSAIEGTGISGPLSELHLPALATLGDQGIGSIGLNQSTLRVLQLPSLAMTAGPVTFFYAPELCVINMRKLTRVQGDVLIAQVPRIPASAFETLRSAATGVVMAREVGCCWPNTSDRIDCSTIQASCAGCRAP